MFYFARFLIQLKKFRLASDKSLKAKSEAFFISSNKNGQSVVEYFLLFAAVVVIAFLSVSIFYDKSSQAGFSFFKKSAQAIMGEAVQRADIPTTKFVGAIGTTGDSWTNQPTQNDWEAWCNDGEVMIGYRDDDDDDARCAKLVPPEGLCVEMFGYYDNEWYGDGDEARCYDNDVARGYADPPGLDSDDYAHCAKLRLIKCSPGAPPPPSGLSIKTARIYQTNQGGDDNQAWCNDGDVATGYWDGSDDEVHCAKLIIVEN